MIRIFLRDARTNMEGDIFDSRTGCFFQIFFDDTGCTYYLGTISSYMESVVFVGNGLAVVTIVSRRNRDFPMCITKVLLSRPNGSV